MFFKKIISIIKIVILFIYTIILSILGGIALLLPDGDKKYFIFARHWARSILKVCRIKVNTEGIEKLKNINQEVIYAANHASMFDIWALQGNLPGELRFIGKKEIIKIPIFGWIWKFSGNIPIDRGSPKAFLRSLERANKTLERGRCIIIYPEGTRTKDGNMLEFKRGSFSVALKSRAIIVPVTINGSFSILKKGSKVINPGKIDLVIHDPVFPSGKKMDRNAQVELMNRIRCIIESAYIPQD